MLPESLHAKKFLCVSTAIAASVLSVAPAQAVVFNFSYDPGTTFEQRVGFEMAGQIWSSYLTDDVALDFHIGATSSALPTKVIGSATPAIISRHDYESYLIRAAADVSSAKDSVAISSLQSGSRETYKSLTNGRVSRNNETIMLTRANAKALGLNTSGQYGGLDGYITVKSDVNWSYDFQGKDDLGNQDYDFLSVAMHEIGHNLGFVSGIDGANIASSLDLFRYSKNSTRKDAIDLSMGSNAYFSIDKGQTNLAAFSSGEDGDNYQASHWTASQAIGLMNPELKAGERVSISNLDLLALDVIGWDINTSTDVDLSALFAIAETHAASATVSDRDHDVQQLISDSDIYKMGYSGWWQTEAPSSQAVPEPISVLSLILTAVLGCGASRQRSSGRKSN